MKRLSKILIILSIFVGSFGAPLQLVLEKTNLSPTNTTQINSYRFDIKTNQAHAALSTTDAAVDGGTTLNYFDCVWWNVACHILNLGYIIAIPTGNALVAVSGMILDFFLLHSISSASYRSGFIEAGWEILRDVTNIFFLFALILLAFKMVVGRGDKKSLVNIILIALTINFSLFMSYAILDASNIFAHIFYNKITTSEVSQDVEDMTIKTESRSLAIADKIDPQLLTKAVDEQARDNFLLKVLAVFIGGVINLTLIKVFFRVALLMLGRTIGLFITIVLSPLAFASIIIPELNNIPYVGFKSWLKDLMKLCFMAPIFLFFLYLTVKFINIGLPGVGTRENIFDTFLAILIPMIAIIAIINLAKTVSEDMAGKIGGMVASKVSGIVSTVGKVALGGAAIGLTAGMAGAALGARGFGAAASRLGAKMGSDRLTKIGRRTSSIGNSLRSRKVDVTQIPGFKKLAGEKATRFTQRITGKSSLARTEGFRKWKRTPLKGFESTRDADEKMVQKRLEETDEKIQAKMDRKAEREEGGANWLTRQGRRAKQGARAVKDKVVAGPGAKAEKSQEKAEANHEKWQETFAHKKAETAAKEAGRKAEAAEIKNVKEKKQKFEDETRKGPSAAQEKGFANELKSIASDIKKATEEKTEIEGEMKKELEKLNKTKPEAPVGMVSQKRQDEYKEEKKTWEDKETKIKNRYTSDISKKEADIKTLKTEQKSKEKDLEDLTKDRAAAEREYKNALETQKEKGKKAAQESRDKSAERLRKQGQMQNRNATKHGKHVENWQEFAAQKIEKATPVKKKTEEMLKEILKDYDKNKDS